jgi:hypothetical protein
VSVPAPDDEELVTVEIRGLPLNLHARAQQQGADMQREFQLIVEQARLHADSVPARLLELSTQLSARYESFSDDQEQVVEDALDAGERQLDLLTFQLPAHAGDAAREVSVILDEADEYCRDGQLLTLATPPDLVAYRRWYLDNFTMQCAGGDPVPWTGSLD